MVGAPGADGALADTTGPSADAACPAPLAMAGSAALSGLGLCMDHHSPPPPINSKAITPVATPPTRNALLPFTGWVRLVCPRGSGSARADTAAPSA